MQQALATYDYAADMQHRQCCICFANLRWSNKHPTCGACYDAAMMASRRATPAAAADQPDAAAPRHGPSTAGSWVWIPDAGKPADQPAQPVDPPAHAEPLPLTGSQPATTA